MTLSQHFLRYPPHIFISFLRFGGKCRRAWGSRWAGVLWLSVWVWQTAIGCRSLNAAARLRDYGREFAHALVRAVFSQDVPATSPLSFLTLLGVRYRKTVRVPE
jgi:hypothetical protein